MIPNLEIFSAEFREGKIIIITAVIFAATIGVFGESLGLLFSRLDPTLQALTIILSLIAASTLVWLTFILFVSPLSIKERLTCRLIYNIRKGEFLVPIFYSYYPVQGMAMNSIRMMDKIDPQFRTIFRAEVSENSQGNLMKDLIDYLIFSWLASSSLLFLSHDSKMEKIDYQTHYPNEIKSNYILKKISDKKNSDKVSSSDEVLARLPRGMKIKKPKSNEIIISNNHVNTKISYDIIYSPLLYVNHLPIPAILDIPLDPRYENMVEKEMGDLRSFTILISVDVEFKFSRIYYVFKRDSLNMLYYKVSVAVRQLKGLFDIDEFASKTSARIQEDQVGKIINIERKIDNLIKDVNEIKDNKG